MTSSLEGRGCELPVSHPQSGFANKKRAPAPGLIFIRTYSRTLHKELFKIPDLLLSCSQCPALAQISPCFLKYDSDSKAPLPMSSGCIQPLAVAMHWGSVCLHSHRPACDGPIYSQEGGRKHSLKIKMEETACCFKANDKIAR